MFTNRHQDIFRKEMHCVIKHKTTQISNCLERERWIGAMCIHPQAIIFDILTDFAYSFSRHIIYRQSNKQDDFGYRFRWFRCDGDSRFSVFFLFFSSSIHTNYKLDNLKLNTSLFLILKIVSQ